MKRAAYVFPAPAKLNAFLHVTGRRRDGYHTLESLMLLVGRADRIALTMRDDGVIARGRGHSAVAPDDDLALRAARLLAQRSGVQRGVTVDVDKRIPIGAGLGGGSSDAATVLIALNRLWNVGLDRAALMRIGRELGADVPFFVFGEAAFARGVGDELLAASVPPAWHVVIAPAVHVATAQIFAAPELTRSGQPEKMLAFSEGYGRNDLYPVAAARFPEIQRCLAALGEASHSGARMTGSGGCVYASFAREDEARRALVRMPPGITGFVARSLARHPLRPLV